MSLQIRVILVNIFCSVFSFFLALSYISKVKGKGKTVPLQAWSGPKCSRKLRFPYFVTTEQDGGKVVGPYKQSKHLNTQIAVLPCFCMTVRPGLCHIKGKRQIKVVGKGSAYGNIWTSVR